MNQRTILIIVVAVILYLAIGLVVGIVTAQDSAGDDLAIGQACHTWQGCQSHNAFLIASGLILWPVFIFSQPLLLLGLAAIIVCVGWLMTRRHVEIRRQRDS